MVVLLDQVLHPIKMIVFKFVKTSEHTNILHVVDDGVVYFEDSEAFAAIEHAGVFKTYKLLNEPKSMIDNIVLLIWLDSFLHGF
jgi:hypothetical protein